MNDLHATFKMEQMDIDGKPDVVPFIFSSAEMTLAMKAPESSTYISRYVPLDLEGWKIYGNNFARDWVRTPAWQRVESVEHVLVRQSRRCVDRIKIVRVRSSL